MAKISAAMEHTDRSMQRKQKGEGFPGQHIVVLPRSVIADARRHSLMSALVPTDVGYFPRAAEHLRERPAGVDQAIFIFCTKGRGWCELNGNRHVVKAGDLLVLPPEIPHLYGADETKPWSIFWFHAQGTLLNEYLRELDVSADRPVKQLGEAPQVLALFEELLEVVEHGYTRLQMLCASQTLAHLIAVMIREHRSSSHEQPSVHQKIAQTITYMKQHLNQSLQVDALAAIANLSRSRYMELFKQQIGYAPIDYFIRLRMHRACQLLDTTDLSVKAIATTLGYEDPLYFSRIFRTVNERSPLAYRKLRKG
jgi:AraC family transcriptional regulator of arabinose operon